MTPLDHLIQSALNAPADEGPATEREIAQHTVAMAIRGAYEATSELVRLRCDPVAGPLVAGCEGELYAVKARIDLLLSELRESEGPKLRLVR